MKKNSLFAAACLLATLATGCGSTSQPTTEPSIEPSTEEPTSVEVSTEPEDREFRFQVISNVDYYNSQPNYIKKDEDGNLYAELRRGTQFFVMFRYSPAIITMDDIKFEIADTEIISKVSSKDNKYLKNKFKANKKGETTMTVYPEAEGIDSAAHTYVINFLVY